MGLVCIESFTLSEVGSKRVDQKNNRYDPFQRILCNRLVFPEPEDNWEIRFPVIGVGKLSLKAY